MNNSSLPLDELKKKGRDITSLKLNCIVSLLGCITSVFVFLNTLIIFPIGDSGKLEIFPLLSLLIGTGGFSMSMIASVIWYSAFVSLIEKNPDWRHLLKYGKSDLGIIGAIGVVVVIFGLLISWFIPSIGLTLLLLSTALVVVLVGYLIYLLNTELERRKIHA